jgi:hypothetical protein
MVSTCVKNKFVGAQAGDKDLIGSCFEEVVKTIAEAEFSNAQKKDDFWLYRKYFDENGNPTHQAYTYFLLYTVPKKQIDASVQRAIDTQYNKIKPDSKETETAFTRLQELYADGLSLLK